MEKRRALFCPTNPFFCTRILHAVWITLQWVVCVLFFYNCFAFLKQCNESCLNFCVLRKVPQCKIWRISPLPLIKMRRAVPAIRYLETVTSTMDVAKDMVAAAMSASTTVVEPFGVVARAQTHGRGTADRHWHSPPGNLMYTIGVPIDRIPTEVLPVLPLLVGIVVREVLQKAMALPTATAAQSVKKDSIKTKWPNDTVWAGKKLSGTLIENSDGFMLIGIGVNIESAPELSDGGRQTVCLRDVMKAVCSPRILGPSSAELAEQLWTELFELLERAESKQLLRGHVVQRFSSMMDWGLILHKRNAERTPVRAVRLNGWGHLVVLPALTGEDAVEKEEVLMSEYLM